MQILRSPKEQGRYPDRDIDCQEALETSFRAISRDPSEDMPAAAGGSLSPSMTALVKKAVAVGWDAEEAEVAISELAQNILDTYGD